MRALSLLILRALLRKAQWFSMQAIVTESAFRSTHFRILYSLLKEMHESVEGDLQIEGLMSAVEVSYGGPQQEGMRQELAEIVMELQEVDEIHPDLLDRQVREFVSKAEWTNQAEYVIENVHGQSFDPGRAMELADRAMELASKVDAEVVEFDSAPLSRAADIGSVRIPLGYSPQLDSSIGGGIGRGELTILLAPPSRGKTSYLCKAGAAAAKAGLGVLHISLEIKAEKVIRRYDQGLTGLEKERLEEEAEWVAKARARVSGAGGRVWVKDWRHKAVTPSDVRTLIRRMNARGQKVDFLILDYLEIMTPDKISRSDRQDYGNMGKEMRATVSELDVYLLTAWQVNRAGVDKRLLSEKDVSESWEIIKHADTIIGLNQNPAMLQSKRMILNIIKQREGTSRDKFTLVSDLDRMIVRARTLADDAIDDPSDDMPDPDAVETMIGDDDERETDSSDAGGEVRSLRQDREGSPD
jgi:replicative DNA helicase